MGWLRRYPSPRCAGGAWCISALVHACSARRVCRRALVVPSAIGACLQRSQGVPSGAGVVRGGARGTFPKICARGFFVCMGGSRPFFFAIQIERFREKKKTRVVWWGRGRSVDGVGGYVREGRSARTALGVRGEQALCCRACERWLVGEYRSRRTISCTAPIGDFSKDLAGFRLG